MIFKDFYNLFPHLEIEQLIEYYSVFDGFSYKIKSSTNDDIFELIDYYILSKYEDMRNLYMYTNDKSIQPLISQILIRLARGDRKSHSIYKKDKISQPQGKVLYKLLFEKGIIKKEFSREKPILKTSRQPLKKELRRYKIEDKIHFYNEQTRFWFTFVEPNIELLKTGKKEQVLKQIINEFEKYVSLTFETLSLQLLHKKLKNKHIISSGSYWDRKIEIDLLINTQDGMNIAGESKWKNHKLCKNVLNSLQKKCALVNLGISHYALFSKSGFSKEIEDIKKDNLMLFSLKDFEELYIDR